MSVPTWSGDEHTLGTFRYRVLWFRVLLVAGVTTGLVGAFGMGHAVGQRHDAPQAEPAVAQKQAKPVEQDSAELEPGGGVWIEVTDCDGETPVTPITTDELKALQEQAQTRAALADAAKDADAAKSAPVHEKLESAKISLHFDGTPFNEAIEFLRDVTQLNYAVGSEARDLIDNESLEVSLRLKDISLVNAIKLILASHEELTYRIRAGVILIQTTDALASSELALEAYAVEDIVSGALQGKGGACLDGDALIELLDEILDDGEGSLEYTTGPEGEKGTLLVRRSPGDQAQVRQLLSYLRTLERESPAQPKWIRDYRQLLSSRKVTLNFSETPLADVISFLQDITGLNLVIASEVDSDQILVSLRLRDVSLKDALTIVLEQARLARSFVNEAILIHDPCETGTYGGYSLEIQDVRDLQAWLESDMIQEIVQNGIGEDFWDEPASIRVHRGQLIVRQTRAQHERIAEVLAKLRVSRSKSARTSSSE